MPRASAIKVGGKRVRVGYGGVRKTSSGWRALAGKKASSYHYSGGRWRKVGR